MRVKVTLSPEAAQLLRRARLPFAGAVFGVLLLGAYALGASRDPNPEPLTPTVSQPEPESTPPPEHREPVRVPSSASGARSSGMGGQTWMAGDTRQLGAEFTQSVSRQFRSGTMGQAYMAMAGMGFDCDLGGGGMSCQKKMKADNCMLTWSVRIQSSGGAVSGAGGDGFSRDCT